jgi:uncharacterized protein YajQ (UPF0234 family)
LEEKDVKVVKKKWDDLQWPMQVIRRDDHDDENASSTVSNKLFDEE